MAPDLITSSVLGGDPAHWPAGKPSKLIQSLKAAPLGRMERIRRFGVDCGDGLIWAAGWQPGGEYTKQLIVKNVSKQVVRIKYKLPESKFFSMAFPETIQLMPGLTTVLQVCLDAAATLQLICRSAARARSAPGALLRPPPPTIAHHRPPPPTTAHHPRRPVAAGHRSSRRLSSPAGAATLFCIQHR